jgi:hypothetical protein
MISKKKKILLSDPKKKKVNINDVELID